MTWYADCQATCVVIAEDTGLTLYQAAGLLAVYSPRSNFSTNLLIAATVAMSRIPMGGPNCGVMATGHMRKQAHRILSGDKLDDVLMRYKTNAFAHLVFHGGDSPKDKATGTSRVCVDRHAYSVACGARANEVAYNASGVSHKRRSYENAANCYRQAADILADREGHHVAPHQVQAAIWIIRQQLNEKEDKASHPSSRSAQQARRSLEQLRRYLDEHHPRASLLIPGDGYSRQP